MTTISVVIPVGPAEHHARWLDECLASVAEQTVRPDSIVIVDDMHGRDLSARCERFEAASGIPMTGLFPTWHLGVGSAFNFGVAHALMQAEHDLALMLGADDRLEPRVVERVVATYERHAGRTGYYWCETEYESGEQQRLACNNAAMTPGFLVQTGGLPVEAAVGGMDAALISAMLAHNPGSLVHVPGEDGARYWSRQHADQESARLNRYGAAMGIVRDVFTQHYRPTSWGRYS